jgi:long-chain acyl-CoA synthetase
MNAPRATTLVQFLTDTVARWPDREFLGTKRPGEAVYDWITYAAFGRRVDALRAGLAGLQVGPGSTVGIIANNRVEWALAHFAALGLGARWVPMYEAELPSAWEFIVKDSGIEVLFVATEELREKVRAFSARTPALRRVITLSGAGDDSLAALEQAGLSHPVAPLQPAPGDVAVLIYTSGTTDRPKGVLLTHANLVSNHFGRRQLFPEFDEQSRTLSILPWAHVYGMGELHTWLQIGGSIGLAGSVQTLLADFALVRPTFILAVPRIFNKIYNALWASLREGSRAKRALFELCVRQARQKRLLGARGDSSLLADLVVRFADRFVFSQVRERFGGRLRGAMTGSAAMSKEVSEFFFDLGLPLYDAYGMTETSPGITLNCPAAHRSGSVGRPLEGVQVTIDRSAVEKGAADGEIIVHGPNVMKGYQNQPEATAAVLTATGGMRTGDRGRFDEDGYLFITGRIKEQFKLENGKYVFPVALEEAIELNPMIASALVYGDGRPFCVSLLALDPAAATAYAKQHGLPGDYRSVVSRPELQKKLTEELAASLQGKFGSYEIPKKHLFVEEPFTVAGGLLTQTLKLKRRQIVVRYQGAIDALYRT